MVHKDLFGQVFGKLTVIDYHGTNKERNAMWLCQCECGKQIIASGHNLRRGNTRSCGCQRAESNTRHGDSKRQQRSRLYQTWLNIKGRCLNPKHPDYKYYGCKGIIICQQWMNYETFRKWAVANGYNDTLTIDRIDVAGNYEPSNCRWVSQKEQANNTTRTRWITRNGTRKSLAAWAEEYGIKPACVYYRLKRGWTIEDALTIPVKQKRTDSYDNFLTA